MRGLNDGFPNSSFRVLEKEDGHYLYCKIKNKNTLWHFKCSLRTLCL
jgi:hypothetical protein